MYKMSSYAIDDLPSFHYGRKKPVAFNVDGWPEGLIVAAAKVAKDLGYDVEFKARNARNEHRTLEIYNNGKDLATFWKKLDENGPAEFRLLK